jgi:hypothetical protein
MRKLTLGVVICVAIDCLSLTRVALAQRQTRNPSSFACNSSLFTLGDFQKKPAVSSPDRGKRVQLTEDYKFRILSGRAVVADFEMPEISSNVEIGWSPDSKQFFVSYSDSGAIGGFHVHMYRLNGSTVTESKVPTLIAEYFETKHWCKSRGNNLYFLAWTPDSRIAFLVAEVYPTSDCGKDMGVYTGYAVDTASAEVLRVFDERQTQAIENNCRASGNLVLQNIEK